MIGYASLPLDGHVLVTRASSASSATKFKVARLDDVVVDDSPIQNSVAVHEQGQPSRLRTGFTAYVTEHQPRIKREVTRRTTSYLSRPALSEHPSVTALSALIARL